MAHKLEELPLFPKMIAFCDAVDAILERPTWRRNRDLHDQIADANFKDRGRYRPHAATKNAAMKNARIKDPGIEDHGIRDSED